MEKLQTVQDKMTEEIKSLDGGWKTVAQELRLSEKFLQNTLNPSITRAPRLKTLEKIKAGIITCREKQKERIEALLS